MSKGFLILFALMSLMVISCSKEKVTTETVRIKQDRAITIINNTGNDISGYQVNVANGPEIKKDNFIGNNIPIIINDNWKNDPNFEIVLVDRYGNIYKNIINVPLEGNTDVAIGQNNKVSQGLITDNLNKIKEFFDKHK